MSEPPCPQAINEDTPLFDPEAVEMRKRKLAIELLDDDGRMDFRAPLDGQEDFLC
jgi:hypothetical protein